MGEFRFSFLAVSKQEADLFSVLSGFLRGQRERRKIMGIENYER